MALTDGTVRRLTAEEVEQLQTLPPGYTSALKSSTRRISLVGNAWTADVIAALPLKLAWGVYLRKSEIDPKSAFSAGGGKGALAAGGSHMRLVSTK